MVKAIASKTNLLEVFKHLKVATKNTSANKLKMSCELTIKTDKICFVVPGIQYELPCYTEGVGRFTCPLLYISDIISTTTDKEIVITILRDKVQVNNVIFKANTTFFEDDTILRSIKLPINYTDADIIKLSKSNYTPEEITFNKLDNTIAIAQQELEQNIEKAYNILKVYGISKEELKLLVEKK